MGDATKAVVTRVPGGYRAAARSRRSESIGSISRATTKEAKRGESGHP